MSVPQLNLNFGSVHHLSDLHAKHKTGIAFSEQREQWREYAAKQYNQAVEFCREHSGSDDSYMAVNGIRPFAKRCFENVSNLTANFVDLDFYTVGLTLDEVIPLIESRCNDLNLPEPSKLIDSGRGAYALWEFEKPIYCGSKVDNAAKRKFAWQDTQAMLISLFSDLGADPKCKDVSRVLRLVGTNNSKVNRPVQCYTFGRKIKSPISFNRKLKALTKPTNKISPALIKPLFTQKGNVSIIRNARTLNFARANDLRKLAELRGGKLTDNRAMAIFYYAMAASYVNVTQEGVCRSVSDFMDRCILCGGKYDSERPEKLLKTLLDKHNKQRTSALDGDYTQIQYRARNQTIINALSITAEEQTYLETIISKEEKQRRNTKAKSLKRRSEGVIDREKYESNARARSDKAKELKTKGVTNKQIALELGVHVKSVSRLLRG